MESFQWDKNFETNIREVDEQHQVLVESVNKLGTIVVEGNTQLDEVEQLLESMIDYAKYHFAEEEALMCKLHVSPNHVREHIKQHHTFIQDIKELQSVASTSENYLAQFYHFLVHWLVYHILGCDKNMARQIEDIQAGINPQEAYEKDERHIEPAVAPLLSSLKSMFEEVSMRNKELIMLTHSLEEKVKERTRELEILSNTDALTSIANRRYVMAEFERWWEQGRQLTAVFIDVDNFKMVNDSFGHDKGDDLLIQLSDILKSTFYTTDIVARLGGDEFMVLCFDTDNQQTTVLAEQALSKIKQLVYQDGESIWQGAVSIGIAMRTPEVETVEQLLKLADESVYMAKEQGKNRICSVQNTAS